MKPGTVVRLADGREGTVVYHGLDGYGIQWGRVEVDVTDLMRGDPVMGRTPPQNWRWAPEAMLRAPYAGEVLECVGEDYEVVASLRDTKENDNG